MFQGYTYDEAVRIITQYSTLVRGIGHIDTYETPQRTLVSGQAEDFFPLPFNAAQQSYEIFLFHYQIDRAKSDWIQARRRELHRWLPMVVIGGQSMPLVPVLIGMHVWNEDWRS
jgi:hypothetical protein